MDIGDGGCFADHFIQPVYRIWVFSAESLDHVFIPDRQPDIRPYQRFCHVHGFVSGGYFDAEANGFDVFGTLVFLCRDGRYGGGEPYVGNFDKKGLDKFPNVFEKTVSCHLYPGGHILHHSSGTSLFFL